MIKIKVFRTTEGRKMVGNHSIGIADYCYCVYLFGFLIHSVTILEIDYRCAESMFKDLEVIEND
jgi:hypothetical protein